MTMTGKTSYLQGPFSTLLFRILIFHLFSVQGYGRQASEEDGGWFYPGSGDTKDTGFRDDSDSLMFIEDDDQVSVHRLFDA